MFHAVLTLVLVAGLVSKGAQSLTNAIETNAFRQITVAKDGSGDYASIQKAIESVPPNNSHRVTIRVRAGLYKEQLHIKNRDKIAIIGDGREKTRVEFAIRLPDFEAGKIPGASHRATFLIQDSSEIIISGITIDNPGQPGDVHTFALESKGRSTKITLHDSAILAFGLDTLSLWSNGLYYHRNIFVQGKTHMVGPRGTAYIEKSVFRCLGGHCLFNEGVSKAAQKMVIKDSRIAGPGPFTLGSYFRDAAWYFVNSTFENVKADGQIQYKPIPDYQSKWGYRVYFYGAKGALHPWMADNLDQSEATSPAEITPEWTLQGWNPRRELEQVLDLP